MSDERRAWQVSGRVQGVGFRWATARRARSLGLAGAVWNRPDGIVEVHARGPSAALDELEKWLARGPSAARVTGVQAVRPGSAAEKSGFEIEG